MFMHPAKAPPRPDANIDLPASFGSALLRGIRYHCPRCNKGKIFTRWLKPVATCPACELDISGQRADDFPAYIALFLTGHLLAPILILMIHDFALPIWITIITIIPIAVAIMVALLQPAKGAVISLQWWNGMHGFTRERRADNEEEA